MTRSRALNRFHRFVAKRRRRSLRASLPVSKEENLRIEQFTQDVISIRHQLFKKEVSLDLLETDSIGEIT